MDAITHQHSENTNISECDAADTARIIDNSRTPSAPLSRFSGRHFSKPLASELLSPGSSAWTGNLLWGFMFSLPCRWHLDHSMIHPASFNSLKNSWGMTGHSRAHAHAQSHTFAPYSSGGRNARGCSGRDRHSTLGTESIKATCQTSSSLLMNSPANPLLRKD